MYPMMTLSSFVRELYRSTSPSKVISWETLYLVFKDRFLSEPYPYLDASDSSQLPPDDSLSPQGNGDFTLSHARCQVRPASLLLATLRCRRRAVSADETPA